MTNTEMKIERALEVKGYIISQVEYQDMLDVRHGKKTADEMADQIINNNQAHKVES